MLDSSLYKGREQTYVKHLVLKRYLEKLAYKIGFFGTARVLNYVDCFAGPWQQVSEGLGDTSPFIAIGELRKARNRLRDLDRPPLSVRGLFVEKDRNAWGLLEEQLGLVQDIEVQAINGEFEHHIDQILDFVSSGFAFFFIDPTGWTGYPLKTIAPILRYQPGEVLINFMTQYVSRFVDLDRAEDAATFRGLFGSLKVRQRWASLSGLEREEEIVQAYCDRVGEVGQFKFVARTTILDPLSDRTYFHLIYATRHIEGLRVFRDAERAADKEQERTRWHAQRRRQEETTGQTNLFEEPVGRTHSEELRQRYHLRAHNHLQGRLEEERRVSFDALEAEALLFPLMSTQDLKEWLVELKKDNVVRFEGLQPRARVPQPGKDHWVVVL